MVILIIHLMNIKLNTMENKIKFDKQTALNSLIDEMRRRRKSILSKLDLEFLISLEDDDVSVKNLIIMKKKALRDITNISVNDFNTIDDMKNLWPVELLGEYPFE
jgi:hypothetical protein